MNFHYCNKCGLVKQVCSCDESDIALELPKPDAQEPILPYWQPRKCECGAEAVGGNKHSQYCPKYVEES